jgi:hypothetical protein
LLLVQKGENRRCRPRTVTFKLQTQAQTRWNPGLTDDMITQYDVAVGASCHSELVWKKLL